MLCSVVDGNQTTWCKIPEDFNINIYHPEDPSSHKMLITYIWTGIQSISIVSLASVATEVSLTHWRILSSEMLHHVALVRTDILEECITSIRVTRIGKLFIYFIYLFTFHRSIQFPAGMDKKQVTHYKFMMITHPSSNKLIWPLTHSSGCWDNKRGKSIIMFIV
jgi:hypothetical protein